MTIETKFNFNDTVWFIQDNKVQSAVIIKMEIDITKEHGNHETCTLRLATGNATSFHVNHLFPTKQALLDSL